MSTTPEAVAALIPRKLSEIDWTSWKSVDDAVLTFVVEGDRVLLIRKKRGLGAGKINGPGGRLDPGETPLQAAVREVQEELCITPTDLVETGELFFQFVDGYSIHVWVFTASGYEGEPSETDEAVPLWFDQAEIPYDEMWADDRIWLDRMLAGERFRGWFIFDDDDMLDERVEWID